jgi:hypothetical protein
LTEGKAGFVVRRLTGKEQRLIKPFGVAERALKRTIYAKESGALSKQDRFGARTDDGCTVAGLTRLMLSHAPPRCRAFHRSARGSRLKR